ncbi:Gfo/Idh/MocA family protein [Staphylococcus intermedius]|uniref:Putative oxidoreductase n=1 Tax=Staphylococcus intermedius NCTC 11048 TaxID=1141106 RepID=A0A380G4V6_STAIN|nr:Gfo/Idh/MocA family oxidoreductase [Staphylococcus intermedius]PCF64150.1 dehydrogenase [Staphylococcus intermedius]PCF78865.1 dehydrogenase [Staphylococcus intermedius]PCF79838.1 dehydrogenase [Staphylococcus intermedius]PCF89503.1 dehydrogenase [Staphylococcus intermedius]PNZ54826.1 gfo/Idh/MocA family oxidoreductase [Staphylococcus intermedius NCTC 11048]
MKPLKIGVIGTGGIARDRHIPLIIAHERAELVGVYDVNETLAREVATQFDIAYVAPTLEALLAQADAVIICTPNQFHAELTIAALDAGVHVLCEKPMAMNSAECDAMIEAANRNARILTIAYHYRFTDVAQAAKQAVAQGAVGVPVVSRVQALRRRKVPGWGVFTNKALQGGGCLIDYGCHVLDLVLWLLDDVKPTAVSGRTYNALSRQPHQLNEWGTFDHTTFDVEDHATSYVTFENGASMQFECSWAANIHNDKLDVSISGDAGGLQLFPFEVYAPRPDGYHILEQDVSLNEDVAAMRQMDHFISSCFGEVEPLVKPEEARRVTQLIDAIYQSDRERQSVEIKR